VFATSQTAVAFGIRGLRSLIRILPPASCGEVRRAKRF
jgi:hypothetical protein